MGTFSLELPFFVPLAEGEYAVNVKGSEFTVSHTRVQHDDLDARLGGVHDNFGFVRDQLGLLWFSRLTAELGDDDLVSLGRALLGESFTSPSSWSLETKSRVAMALFNQFLDRYRAATRNLDARSLGRGDLARLHVEDGQSSSDISLYGGGITLPVVGLTPEYHQRVVQRLAAPDAPASYELSALDARRAVENGMAGEALVMAAGALESAIDIYLSRSWRLGQPRVLPKDAGKQIDVGGSDIRTIDDILEKGQVSTKIKSGAIAKLVPNAQAADSLVDALEVRNLAVHGGFLVPPKKARRHVEAMTIFVLDHLVPVIQLQYPQLPRPEFLYAYEEAMGTACPSEIEGLAATYLVGARLTAKLYNRKATRHNMFSEGYGDTLVMRVAFGDFEAHQIDLFIARALLRHWLERRGIVAFARVAVPLPDEATRPFWSAVASRMTSAVWGAAIDRRLGDGGLGELVRQEIDQQASELRQKYGPSYIAPAFEQLGYWVDYLEFARIASALPAPERMALVHASAGPAPQVTRRALRAVPAMEVVDFDDPASILRTLIAVHDAHEGILATVPIYDPATHKEYGLGLSFEDISEVVKLL